VGALLEAYPRAARLKDQMGKLPVTLATEFGSSAEVVEKLLTIYPEGMFVRDSDGKGPMDYARGKGSRRVMAAMERGRVYCAVSKAAFFRIKEEFDDLMRGTVESHNNNVIKLERIHSEEIDVHRQLEAGLQTSLKSAQVKVDDSEDVRDMLTQDNETLRIKVEVAETAESSLGHKSDMLEKEMRTGIDDVNEKEKEIMALRGRTEAVCQGLEAEARRNSDRVERIASLKGAILSLSASVSSLTVTQTDASEGALVGSETALRSILGDRRGIDHVEDAYNQVDVIVRETARLEDIYASCA